MAWRQLGAALCCMLLPGTAHSLTLEELMQGMASASGVEARFVEVQELSLLSVPLESRGSLYFVPPDRLARFTESPSRTALVIDGKSVRFRDEKQEVDLSASPIARQVVSNLIVLWSGDIAELRSRYDAKLRKLGAGAGGDQASEKQVSDDQDSDGQNWELELTPRRAPLDRFLASITLRGSDRVMREMSVLDAEGNRTTTRFESVDGKRHFDASELARLFERGEALHTTTPLPTPSRP